MADISYKINFDLGSKLDAMSIVNREVFPLLHQAVQAVAQHTAANWQEAVYKTPGIWSEEKDRYAQSITWSMSGDFSAVVQTDYQVAQEIETGRPARDLKKMLGTSLKVRRTEKGKRFLVIPLRHNTPGNGAHAKPMPEAIYNLAKAMSPSRITGQGMRPSGEVTHLSPTSGMRPSSEQSPFASMIKTRQAAQVTRNQYAWGGRLTKAAMAGAGVDAATRKRYAGMVRMDTSTPGGAKSSSYMTFRVMIEGQTGWVVPAQPGKYIAQKVVAEMTPKAIAAFGEAIKRTIGS